jgi:hypothetical protein
MNLGIFGFPANGSNTASTLIPRIQTYTTAGTYSWTVPDGVIRVALEIWGGGGGGYNDGGGNFAYGGGGGYAFSIVSVVPGEVLTVVVGAGGANQAAVAFNAGGTSSVASAASSFTTVSATGGTAAGAGGVGSNGKLNASGGAGGQNGAYAAIGAGMSPHSDVGARASGLTLTGPGTGGSPSAVGSGQAGSVFIYY